MKRRAAHPLEHHPSFRAVIAAAPPVAELERAVPEAARDRNRGFVGILALVCADLAQGFAQPPGSRARAVAHHRAWIAVRDLERALIAVRIHRHAPARLVAKAQRAIDRADVMISALPGVLPA